MSILTKIIVIFVLAIIVQFEALSKIVSIKSYHPAGVSKISDFDSDGLCVARVQRVDEEVGSSGPG